MLASRRSMTKIAGSGSEPDPNPDPLVRGMDPRIRIHPKMSWSRNTAWYVTQMKTKHGALPCAPLPQPPPQGSLFLSSLNCSHAIQSSKLHLNSSVTRLIYEHLAQYPGLPSEIFTLSMLPSHPHPPYGTKASKWYKWTISWRKGGCSICLFIHIYKSIVILSLLMTYIMYLYYEKKI